MVPSRALKALTACSGIMNITKAKPVRMGTLHLHYNNSSQNEESDFFGINQSMPDDVLSSFGGSLNAPLGLFVVGSSDK